MSDAFWTDDPRRAPAGPSPPGALLDVLAVAAVVLDEAGRIVLWSPQAEELFGYSAEEALGEYAARLLVDERHLELVIDLFAQVMEGGGPWAGVFPVRRRDGSTRLAEFRNMRLEDRNGGHFALGLATDRSTLRRVERDLAVAVRLIAQTPMGVGVLDTGLRFVTVNPALERLNGLPAEAHVGRHVRDVLPFLDTEAIEDTMRQVLATGRPVVDESVTGRTPADPGTERAWRVSYHCLEDPAGNVLGLAVVVVDVTEQHRSAAQAARARRQLALVADASKHIGTTLDVETTARELAEFCVPELADTATVDVLDQVTGAAHPAGGRPDRPAFHPAATVGAPSTADDTRAAAGAPDPLVARCLTTGRPVREPLPPRPGAGARLVVPLTARGHTLGALDLVRSRTPRPFDRDDLTLAEELASRAAVCLDNARGYQDQRHAALALQRHLLPHRPPRRTGLRIAARYRPARAACDVGGDWFDVIPAPHDRTTLVIGDVMGNGIPAAATMGQLRTAIRMLAALGLDPAHVLQHVDEHATGLEHDIATCVLAAYDPHETTCHLATAGHLPPVLLRTGEPARLLDLPTGAPLGVGGIRFHTVPITLRPGDRLVLYTDGLVETRDQPIDARLHALLRTLDDPPAGPEDLCDLLLRTLHGDDQDDTTVLVARATAPHGHP